MASTLLNLYQTLCLFHKIHRRYVWSEVGDGRKGERKRERMDFLESMGQALLNHIQYLGLYVLGAARLQQIIQRDLLLTRHLPRTTSPSLQLSCSAEMQLKKPLPILYSLSVCQGSLCGTPMAIIFIAVKFT